MKHGKCRSGAVSNYNRLAWQQHDVGIGPKAIVMKIALIEIFHSYYVNKMKR